MIGQYAPIIKAICCGLQVIIITTNQGKDEEIETMTIVLHYVLNYLQNSYSKIVYY